MSPSLASDLGGRRLGRFSRIAALLALAAGCLLSSGCLRMGGEMRELRDAVLASLDGDVDYDKEIELSLGPVSLGLARTAVRFAHDLPDEARMGLQAVRRAEVGVYTLRGNPSNRWAVVTSASEALERRGWERAVTVLDGSDTVLVFVPRDLESRKQIDVCVVVLDDADFVVAKARLAPEPLGSLIARAMKDASRKHAHPAEGDEHEPV